jgi:ABC-type nitrate/sulfonate/bicarbonate transport system permease component
VFVAVLLAAWHVAVHRQPAHLLPDPLQVAGGLAIG